MKFTQRIGKAVVTSAALAALSLVLSPTAQARQDVFVVDDAGPAVFGGPFMGGPGAGGLSVSGEQFERYAGVLGLDDVQRELADELYSMFVGELSRLSEAHMERISALRAEFEESRDHSVFIEKMPAVLEELTAGREAATTALFDDLQLLLTPEQEARWPAFERARRRDVLLPQGSMSGESVDLVRLASDLKIERADDGVGPILDAYEKELDRALLEREKLGDAMASLRGGPGGFDLEKMMEQAEERRAVSMKVRGINQSFYERLVSGLGPEQSEALSEAFQSASFPQVYRPSYIEKAFEVAASFEDLTPAQREGLAQLRADHERQRAKADAAWAREIRQAEDDGSETTMTFGGGSFAFSARVGEGGEKEETDLDKAVRGRRELDDQTLARIHSLLGEDQVARLPERKRMRRLPNGMEIEVPGDVMERAVFITEEIGDDGAVRRTEVEITGGTGEQPEGDEPGEEIEIIVVPVEEDEEDGTDG